MRTLIFTCGVVIVATGIASLFLLPKPHSIGFFQGAMTLGGGILISGLFSLRMQWHGYIAAGIMALLGTARGLGNLPGLLEFFAGNRARGTAPVLELGITLISLLLFLRVIAALKQERTRRMLAAD